MERINNRYTRDMKQTAIEWLVEQLENHNGVTRSGFEKCIQQAKAMEKQQIHGAWVDGFYTDWRSSKMPNDYYKETFKSE